MMAEMKEFASFPASTQRYIRRSLDVGLLRDDAVVRWSRDVGESAGIRAQMRCYDRLEEIRDVVPHEVGLGSVERMMGALLYVTAFDLGQNRLPTFQSYRFLYERLLGARVRPWLPSSFCGAAALPTIHVDMRRRMLKSISEAAATAAGWSTREASFMPDWVEKVEESKAA
jgi:hypothetical protein